MNSLTRIHLWRVALRALWLQAAFNPERRQALGVASALAPVIEGETDHEARRRFLLRHLGSYNTNPALAGPLLGAVARLELEARAEQGERLKRGMEGPLAAQGDALLWTGARPAAALAGGALAWLGGGWGPTFFLVAYNAVHLGLRVGGVFWGFRMGDTVHLLLRSPRLRRGIMGCRSVVWIAGLCLGGLVFAGAPPGPVRLGTAALALGLVLGRRGFARGTLLASGAIITGLILGTLFGSGAF